MYTPVEKETRQPRICIPFTEGNGMRLTVFYEAHESVLHGGMDKTYMRVANTYWWPGLYRDCANYVKSCKECRRFASAQKRPEGASESHEIPGNRWDVICADWITDLPVTDQGHDAILAVHDKITKYAYLIPASKSDTAERTAERLFAHVFSQHGLPRSVVSDRDKLFTARFFAQLMRIVGVRHSISTNPSTLLGRREKSTRDPSVLLCRTAKVRAPTVMPHTRRKKPTSRCCRKLCALPLRHCLRSSWLESSSSLLLHNLSRIRNICIPALDRPHCRRSKILSTSYND